MAMSRPLTFRAIASPLPRLAIVGFYAYGLWFDSSHKLTIKNVVKAQIRFRKNQLQQQSQISLFVLHGHSQLRKSRS